MHMRLDAANFMNEYVGSADQTSSQVIVNEAFDRWCEKLRSRLKPSIGKPGEPGSGWIVGSGSLAVNGGPNTGMKKAR
jgi:hypothetical protein